MQLPNLKGVRSASENLKDVSSITPLTLNDRLSKQFNSRVFLKREDLQKEMNQAAKQPLPNQAATTRSKQELFIHTKSICITLTEWGLSNRSSRGQW